MATRRDLPASLARLASPSPAEGHRIPLGLAPVDAHLGGGLLSPALHEIDAAVAPGASLLLAAALAACSGRPVVWVRTRADLFAPALAQAGLGPEHLTHVEVWRERFVLSAAEEALRAGAPFVVAEVRRAGLTATRRLQLAAEGAGALALLVRSGPAEGGSAARSRWRAVPLPAGAGDPHRLPRARWRLELLRARGTAPAAWEVLAPDGAGWMALADDGAGLRGAPHAVVAGRPGPADARGAA